MLFASAGAASSGNGGNFLIPNGTFVELVIFLIVLGVVAKWILPPLKEVSETRQGPRQLPALPEGGGGARREPEPCSPERDRVLTEARAQARVLVDRVNQGADQAVQDGRQRGQQEYDRLVNASRGPRRLTRVAEPAWSSSGGWTCSWPPPPSGCSAVVSMSTRDRELIDEAIAAVAGGVSERGAG